MAEERILSEQEKVRRDKLKKLESSGELGYKNGLCPSAIADDLQQKYTSKSKEELEAMKIHCSLAGRMMAIRSFGKAAFVRVRDRSGFIQLFVQKNSIGEEAFARFKELDIGDIVFAEGHVFKTNTGELSLHVEKLTLVSKSLHPLPEKFHGLQDVEVRYRQRYLDLMMSDETKVIVQKRAKTIQAIREFLIEREFLEVETPMMHPVAGGATAKPFVTHHNTLDMTLYLRIAPELYLKRLVVGGIERVFEINRNFRNEGISIQHNPEFTMLEFYQAYATYEDLIVLTQEMFQKAAIAVNGSTQLEYEGTAIELGGQWNRMTVEESLLRLSQFKDASKLRDPDALVQYCKSKNFPMARHMGVGALQMVIFDEEVQPQLIQPTFITHYPLEVSPLSRKNEKDPFLVDRFELFIYGREMANAFSELNDPVDQKERFEAQMRAKEQGNEEAHDIDEDYVTALEYGMPPAAGEGVGIDRLVMLLTNSSSIRDVILFPHMRWKD